MDHRNQNIILFAAGQSKENVDTVKKYLKDNNQECYDWPQIFTTARNEKTIALLPMLLKKIPTFDFAIILGDGIDSATMKQIEGEIEKEAHYQIIRDNVLFECGLCIMALGTGRVILLIEEGVRIPADFLGLNKDFDDIITDDKIRDELNLGIKKIVYSKDNIGEGLPAIIDHINNKATTLSPIVIGAAISTAEGYFSNFILRFWENITDEYLVFKDSATDKEFRFHYTRFQMKVYIPEIIDSAIKGKIFDYYKSNNYKEGIIYGDSPGNKPNEQVRAVVFRYKMDGEKIIICDIPTTLTASYSTVMDILNIDADEDDEKSANLESKSATETRFLTKERESFKFTLEKLKKEEELKRKLATFASCKVNAGKKDARIDEEKIDTILKAVKGTEISDISTKDLIGSTQ